MTTTPIITIERSPAAAPGQTRSRIPSLGTLLLAAMEAFGRFEARRADARRLETMPAHLRDDIGLDDRPRPEPLDTALSHGLRTVA
ncbi:MAG: hypothetical protein AAGE83_10710 [Pseudomonadota bacterium]